MDTSSANMLPLVASVCASSTGSPMEACCTCMRRALHAKKTDDEQSTEARCSVADATRPRRKIPNRSILATTIAIRATRRPSSSKCKRRLGVFVA
eukprot:6864900-Prymnesium_polylepis.2